MEVVTMKNMLSCVRKLGKGLLKRETLKRRGLKKMQESKKLKNYLNKIKIRNLSDGFDKNNFLKLKMCF